MPGSHVWDDERKPHPSEVTYGEMDPGDALLMLGNTYHGAGANVTTDEFRSVVVTLLCKGVYRQEENQFLAADMETVRKMDYDVQDLLGVSIFLVFILSYSVMFGLSFWSLGLLPYTLRICLNATFCTQNNLKGTITDTENLQWKASAPFCGWHDLSNPSDLIRPKNGLNRDLF